MSDVRRIAPGHGGRAGVAAILALGVAWALLMHSMGWAQSAHYAQVRALAQGQAEIDPWHWHTQDKAWIDGHFYSVKAPGLPLLTLPVYVAIDALGGYDLAREATRNARKTEHPRWTLEAGSAPPHREFGYNRARAEAVWEQVELSAPIVWALTLVGAVAPAVLLLFGVRWLGDRIEPGFGTAAAITLGVGTIVLTFAAEYFAHVIGAALAFAAFLVLVRERQGPARVALVGGAGLLAGLAVSFEYPVALVGAVLFFYAIAGPFRLARAAAYAAGAAVGALPALLFNWWALGSPLRFAYSAAVIEPGDTGHAEVGLNDEGLFGITAPSPGSAFELLFASRGILTLTPVLVMAVVGVVLMWRRGRTGEAGVIAAVTAVFFVYNAGYWLPFGGGTPGPRFLVPILPFLALGLACAYRRFPALTLALAIPSGILMLAGTLTFPLLGDNGIAVWVERLYDGKLEHTLLTVLGVSNAWLALVPVAVAVAAAVALAALATPRVRIGDVRAALAATLAWALVSIVGPSLAGDPVTPLDDGRRAVQLVGLAAGASILTLAVLRYRERRAERAAAGTAGAPALGERIS